MVADLETDYISSGSGYFHSEIHDNNQLRRLRKKKMSGLQFDLIHAHDRIFNADVFTMHGIPHRLWVREIRKKRASLFDIATSWVEARLLQNQNCIKLLAVSELASEKLIQQYGKIDPGRLEIVRPGIEIEDYRDLDRQAFRKDLRADFGIAPDEAVILFVSMNFDIKGLDSLMAGLSRFKSSHSVEKWRLLVVGKGEQRKYKKLAADLDIGENILFAGIVPRERLKSYYLASDFFAMPSKFDTFGMTVLEAMAASLPVVISANVGAKDIVRDGINGFIILDTSNPDEMAARIGVLMNRRARETMALQAFKTAQENSWEAAADRVKRVYDMILTKKRNRP